MFVNMNNPKHIKEAITDKTRMVWVETPTNPMMNVIDIKAVAILCKAHGIMLAVDNTFASPY